VDVSAPGGDRRRCPCYQFSPREWG